MNSVSEDSSLELSFVMPCLNEAETLEKSIRKAQSSLEALDIKGEVIVADNGSTDRSVEIAERLGARVVRVQRKGYGSALNGGIEAARGRYIIMGDADDSYDFSSVELFVRELRAGHDLVMGNRFRGGVAKGAMPWKNRYIGNPVLSAIGRLLFKIPARDFHCGLRAFTKDAFHRMQLRTTGMEFASEMVIKASLSSMRITEVPTILWKDGRSRPPHLRPWRDGWRHLRFMLLFSPRWMFFYPGAVLTVLGLGLCAWLKGGVRYMGPVGFDIHSMLVAGFMSILGFQLVIFSVFTKLFAIREGLHQSHTHLDKFQRFANLEAGVILGVVVTLAGLALLMSAFLSWGAVGFGNLDPRVTMRVLIPAMVITTIGAQTVFASFLLGLLGIKTR